MSNVYLGRLKDGNGDIVYPATQTSVVYDANGVNIDEKVRHFLHADEPIPHIQAGEINAHTLDGKDLDYIISHAGGVTFDDVPTEGSQNAVRSGGIFDYVAAAKAFSDNPDNVPTENSGKGVTSGGVFNYAAPKVSPSLTGTPTAPTAEVGTNTTQIATTEFVHKERGSMTEVYVNSTSVQGNLLANVPEVLYYPSGVLSMVYTLVKSNDITATQEWNLAFNTSSTSGVTTYLTLTPPSGYRIKWKDGVPVFNAGKFYEISLRAFNGSFVIVAYCSETDIS